MLLDDFLFIDDNIFKEGAVKMIMGNKTVDGTISIAVSVAFGIIIYYSFKFLLSHLTLKSEENPYTFLIRMIIIILVFITVHGMESQPIGYFYVEINIP